MNDKSDIKISWASGLMSWQIHAGFPWSPLTSARTRTIFSPHNSFKLVVWHHKLNSPIHMFTEPNILLLETGKIFVCLHAACLFLFFYNSTKESPGSPRGLVLLEQRSCQSPPPPGPMRVSWGDEWMMGSWDSGSTTEDASWPQRQPHHDSSSPPPLWQPWD